MLLFVFSVLPLWESESLPVQNNNDWHLTQELSQDELDYWCDMLNLNNEQDLQQLEAYQHELIGLGKEIVNQRNQNTKIFVDSDNMVTYRIFSSDIHYKTINGEWNDFDLAIRDFEQTSGLSYVQDKYDYGCDDNTLRSYFKNDYTESNSIVVSVEEIDFGWTPTEMAYFDFESNRYNILNPVSFKPVITNNKILYPETYPSISELYTVSEHTLKHDVIIESFQDQAPESASITGLAHTGVLKPSENMIMIIDGINYPNDGKTYFGQDIILKATENLHNDELVGIHLPKPFAYELNDMREQINCEYQIKYTDHGYEISIVTPYDWLANPARHFPVVVDPSFEVSFIYDPDEINSHDTFISYGNADNVDDNFGNDKDMIIGGNYLNDSALIKFNISSLPDSSIDFHDAIMTLRSSSYPGFDTQASYIAIFNMEQDWLEGTGSIMTPGTDGATWNGPRGTGSTWVDGPGGTYADAFINRTLVDDTNKDYTFDLSDLLRGSSGWRKKPETNYGIYVRYEQPELFANRFKSFWSSKSETPAFRPKLDVKFLNSPPTVKPLKKYLWNEDEDSSITIIDLDDHFSDADHDKLNITLWNGSGWGQKFESTIFTATLLNYGNPTQPEYYCIINLNLNRFGTQKITFNATDRISYVESEIEIEIKSINDQPTLKPIGDLEAIEDDYLYVPLEVIEVENQKVFWDTNVSNYGSQNYMENLWIDPDPDEPNNNYKKQLVFLPDNSNVPEIKVSIIVRDEKHTQNQPSRDWENITITVENVNDVPVLTKVDYTVVLTMEELTLSVKQNELKSFFVQAYDDDIENGDEIEFDSDTEQTDNFTITELTGADVPVDFRGANRKVVRVDFIPNNDHVGEFNVILSVEDTNEASDEITLKFNVKNKNDKPVIKSHIPRNNAQFTNRDNINFSCVVDDPDFDVPLEIYDEKLNVTWYNNVSGKLEKLGYGTEVKYKNFKAGEYKIEILARDKGNLEARQIFTLKILKSITLENQVDRSYKDNSSYDDIEYSYNTKTKKFTISQGIFGEIDLVRLFSYFEDENLVIRLRFYENLTPPVDFKIRIYLVNIYHHENDPDYDVEWTATFYDKILYTPGENFYFGYFTEEDGRFDQNNLNEFVIEYPLADLEEGVDGRFTPIDGKFEIFALVKSDQKEYVNDVVVENFRYDSIGYGSAFAPPPPSGKEKKDGDEADFGLISIGIIIIVVVIILVVVFLLFKRRKKDEDTTVIDFSKARAPGPGQAGVPTQQQIPQMFMSPFEQQFKRPPMPPQPGQPGMGMGGMGAGGMPQMQQQQQMPMQQQQVPQPQPTPPPTQPGSVPTPTPTAPTPTKPGQPPQA
jgi:hypothetical protein